MSYSKLRAAGLRVGASGALRAPLPFGGPRETKQKKSQIPLKPDFNTNLMR
jgi:hypothetical protein